MTTIIRDKSDVQCDDCGGICFIDGNENLIAQE